MGVEVGGAVDAGGGTVAVGGNNGNCGFGRQEFIFKHGAVIENMKVSFFGCAFTRSYH